MPRLAQFLFTCAVMIACAWFASTAHAGQVYNTTDYCAGVDFQSPSEASACIIKVLQTNGGQHPVPWILKATGSCGTPADPAVFATCTFQVHGDCYEPVCGFRPPVTDDYTVTDKINVKPFACDKGKTVSSGYFDIGVSASASPVIIACRNACELIFDGSSPAGNALVGGVKHYFASGSYVSTGNGCDPSNQGPDPGAGGPSLPPDACAPGQVMGTVNGKKVCAAGGPASAPTSTPPTVPKDPSTSKTDTTTTTNPDGSQTTTTTTTTTSSGGGSSTTTTSTTTKPDGSSTSTSTTTGSGPVYKPPGSGSSTGTGTETGNDSEKTPCELNSSDTGCGGNPAALGSIRTAGTRTVGDAIGDARNAFMASALGSAVGGFFNVNGAAACPAWLWDIPYLDAHVNFNFFCLEFATTAFALMKAVVLVVASFFAFRIAVE